MSVDFITFCHPKHLEKVHSQDRLKDMVDSHNYSFDEIILVHQRCKGIIYRPITEVEHRIVESENYPNIMEIFGMDVNDPVASKYTHGPSGPHFWVYHNLNHVIGVTESKADFIVFSDCDCYIKSQGQEQSWIDIGVNLLESSREVVFMVSPGDGGQMFEAKTPEGYRLTKNVSQQLFLVRREDFLNMDFNIEWDPNDMSAPGGPFGEYYFLAEGRIWRHLRKNNQWRAFLPDSVVRYWHEQW